MGDDSTHVSYNQHEMSPSPLEGYDTWEASVLIEDTCNLRKELVESNHGRLKSHISCAFGHISCCRF